MKNFMLRNKTLFVLALVLFIGIGASAQQKATLCPLSAGSALSITSSGATQVIAIPTGTAPPIFINGVATANPAGPKIVICRVDILVNQAGTAADFGLVTGTGTNCGTGQANLTPQWVGTASVIDKYQALFGSQPLFTPAGRAVCLKLSAAPTKAQVFIQYGIVAN